MVPVRPPSNTSFNSITLKVDVTEVLFVILIGVAITAEMDSPSSNVKNVFLKSFFAGDATVRKDRLNAEKAKANFSFLLKFIQVSVNEYGYAREWPIVKIDLETLMISFRFETVKGMLHKKKTLPQRSGLLGFDN